MPYQWTTAPDPATREMRLWPHQSLPARGFAAFMVITFALILIPTVTLLGTVLLWGMLPFVMGAVAAIYAALRSNNRSRQITEILTLDDETARLTHTSPRGEVQEWECNRYWAQVRKYDHDGPVPHYVTLSGAGREVEIGAFLSEDERIALYEDLQRAIRA